MSYLVPEELHDAARLLGNESSRYVSPTATVEDVEQAWRAAQESLRWRPWLAVSLELAYLRLLTAAYRRHFAEGAQGG